MSSSAEAAAGAAPPLPDVRAVIVSLAGTRLTAEERRLFEAHPPFGFILFARNVDDPGQLRALTAELADLLPHAPPPILVDQEGGRVQRLKPPHWRQAPPAARLAELYARDREAGRRATFLNARLLAAELEAHGFTVDCTPCLDLARPETHGAIGDRAHGATPESVSVLGDAVIDGMLAGGLLGVIKHLPGHGRATVDSHHQLPRIEASRAALEAGDFLPFRNLARRPVLGMTGHLLLPAVDPTAPATTSATVIDTVIRDWIGFDGLLLSDDLCMQALSGSPERRLADSLAAGCDIGLMCSGDYEENRAVLGTAPALPQRAWQRWQTALAGLRPDTGFDPAEALTELESLLSS